ncbi:MAG: NADPH-dependent FMN reductase [Candidatus Sumerlaeaceae bacterium]
MIEVISGTNRPQSNSLKVARVIEGLYNELGVQVQILDLQEMPLELFKPTAYAEKPEGWKRVTDRILNANGLHVVTPEYNGSFPGVLKYFIDMLPFPQSFEHRCVAFTGQSAGIWGAFRSVEQLQMIFGYRNAYVLPERVWMPGINARWAEDGTTLKEAATMDLLRKQVREFKAFVERNGDLAVKS